MPSDEGELLTLLQHVHHYESFVDSTQTIVHCTAGIGRTGVYLVADIMVHKMLKGLVPDPPFILRHLREMRSGLIQTPEQFRLCYKAGLKCVRTSGPLLRAHLRPPLFAPLTPTPPRRRHTGISKTKGWTWGRRLCNGKPPRPFALSKEWLALCRRVAASPVAALPALPGRAERLPRNVGP